MALARGRHPKHVNYVRVTMILKGTPPPDGLSPGDVHRHALSLLQNRLGLGTAWDWDGALHEDVQPNARRLVIDRPARS
jgi:hypothetical protein